MTKKVARVWYTPSKSNPKNPPHETLQYEDGSTSCNCRGWCQHLALDGTRTCTHTRKVDSGLAGPPDHEYIPVYTAPAPSLNALAGSGESLSKKAPVKKVKKIPVQPAEPEKELVSVVRKIQWD